MNTKQLIFPFLAGIAAGAAAGYYLNSDQGREQVEKAKEVAQHTKDQAQAHLEAQIAKMNQQLNDTLSSLQRQIDQLKVAGEVRVAEGQKMVHNLTEEGLDKTIAAAEKLKHKAEKAKANLNHA